MKIRHLLYLATVLSLNFSCDMDDSNEKGQFEKPNEGYLGITVPSGFDFETTQEIRLRLSASTKLKEPIPFVTYSIYDSNPFQDGKLLQKVRLEENGSAEVPLNLPMHLDYIWVATDFIGVEPLAKVPINHPQMTYSYEGQAGILPEEFFQSTDSHANSRISSLIKEINTLGGWSETGRPDYLVDPGSVSESLLKNVNRSLPEQVDIRKNNPSLLDDKFSREIYLQEDSEVWITYVHTGAGYRNLLGYYWYKDSEKPKSPDDIKNKTIIFPNIQNGVLQPGDRVKLNGPKDGGFEGGTHIGWFLIADSWKRDGVTSGNWILYGDKNLNTQIEDPNLREHMVMLYDASEKILLMGWEDIKRDNRGCDHDFNDVVFYASWNPITSVDLSEFAPIDTSEKDTDGDGVPDHIDEYPDDPERAFNNYFPSAGSFGTLLFEDLWPRYGDYDMNDLVVDYRVMEVSDALNNIKELEITTVIRATGAGYRNGLGVTFPVPASRVEMIRGQRHTSGYIKTTPKGGEDGQQFATVIITDDVNFKIPIMANVFSHNIHHPEDTLKVSLTFANAVRKSELGTAPYNPFMVIEQDRPREVHLINKNPTDLMDKTLLGTADDNSDPSENRYFLSKNGLNWALNIPTSIPYTIENVDFTKAYLKFGEWAKSGGKLHRDWYLDNNGNINSDLLYKK